MVHHGPAHHQLRGHQLPGRQESTRTAQRCAEFQCCTWVRQGEEGAEQAAKPSYYEVISAEEDTTLRFVMQITSGITAVIERVQVLLVYWEKKYKHLWDQDKDATLWCRLPLPLGVPPCDFKKTEKTPYCELPGLAVCRPQELGQMPASEMEHSD